jgi:hypothetical protein
MKARVWLLLVAQPNQIAMRYMKQDALSPTSVLGQACSNSAVALAESECLL